MSDEKQAAKRDASQKRRPPRPCETRRRRRRSPAAPVCATVGVSKQSGRATLERPRPDTGGYVSHARTIYRGLQLAQVEYLPADMQRDAIGLLARLLLNAAARERDR